MSSPNTPVPSVLLTTPSSSPSSPSS
ncbi:hypothetical protein E2C01_059119 [Portunus trituberculatus]|uniref:Uncharacterized protein n=1 Tax=Portunus trituberculatus TaxID=210409 RepID=A0A5B7H4Z2_PORTR|nr:hypothetical protein [Portunus trituberculatus]